MKKGKEMYKYTFPKIMTSYIKKRTKLGSRYWEGESDYIKSYFKLTDTRAFYKVYSVFYKNLDYTYHSEKKLNKVPFAGYLLPVNLFEETIEKLI